MDWEFSATPGLNICTQMKAKLTAEEQYLLLVRFVEFAHTNSKEFENNVHIFSIVAELFNISEDEFRDILAFITDSVSSNIIVIDGKNETGDFENHISRIGMEGHITVLLIKSCSPDSLFKGLCHYVTWLDGQDDCAMGVHGLNLFKNAAPISLRAKAFIHRKGHDEEELS